MTRLQQYRIRRARQRTSQERLEAALDAVIPSLELPPSEAFQAVLAYAIDGLVGQGTVYQKQQALRLVSDALTKRGIIG